MNLGTLTVCGSKFRLPCVYQVLADGVTVYVGRSNSGFSRAFRGYGSRENDRRTTAFTIADQIRVTVFDNVAEAKAYEISLIEEHSPVYNTHFNRRTIWTQKKRSSRI